MAATLKEALGNSLLEEDGLEADAPADGATDSVGIGEHLRGLGHSIDEVAEGAPTEMSLEDARQHVSDAHSALVALGLLGGAGDSDLATHGVFGPATQAALEQFQEEYDLERTGKLDADTYEVLMAAYEQALETTGSEEREDDFDPLPGRPAP